MKKETYDSISDGDRKILEKLRWDKSPKIQTEAFEYILNNKEFNMEYFVPPYTIAEPEIAAEVLLKLGYERTKDITYDLITWIEDINYAGAGTILELLMSYPNDYFMPSYEEVIKKAFLEDDEIWLQRLAHFLRIGKVTKEDFTNRQFYDIIKNYI